MKKIAVILPINNPDILKQSDLSPAQIRILSIDKTNNAAMVNK